MTAVQPIVDEATGEGWKALIFDGRIILAIDPDGDALPRALRELLTPVEMYQWDADWQHEDQAGWDIYHVCRMLG